MKGMQRTLIVLVAAALFAASRAAAVEFAAAKSYAVGTNPVALVVADFNGDGKPDLAVLNQGSNNVSILLGNGDGTFQPALNFDAGSNPSTLAVGDFDGDGKVDLAVFMPGDTNTGAPGEVRILFGNGNGTLQPPVTTTLTSSATAMAVADFNGDRKGDVILSSIDPATAAVTLQIRLGNGDGTFQAPKAISVAASNPSVAVADFNKDGKLDIAVPVGGGAQILLGKGDGTFVTGGSVSVPSGFLVNSILTADFNADGAEDLILNTSETVPAPCPILRRPPCFAVVQAVSVFLGQGNGGFSSGLSSAVADVIRTIGDFNGDHKTDLMGNRLRLGKGDGTFAVPVSALSTIDVMVAVDLNADKLDDVVVLDRNNNGVLVSINTSPQTGADLGIVSAGPDGSTLGQGRALTYSADVLNAGPQDATNVTFTDTLPSTVTFVSATSSVGSCTESNLVVTCVVASLPDAADVQITITVTPTATGAIVNTMSVSATETDLALANNSATQTDTVVPVYTITVTKAGNGTGLVRSFSLGTPAISCGTTCSASLLSGSVLNLGHTADPGSLFQSWGGACSGNGSCSVTMTADMNVTATFVLGVTLTVSVTGGGTGTVTSNDNVISCSDAGGTCSNLYLPGTMVSLTATPSGGSTFNSWTGGCAGLDPNSCSVTLNTNQTVTATFLAPPTFTINASTGSLSGTAGGQVTDTLSFAPQNGFASAIQLSCLVSGPAPLPTCGLSPSSIPAGANSPTSTLTVNIPTGATLPLKMQWPMPWSYPFTLALLVLLAAASCVTPGLRFRRTWVLAAVLVAVAFAFGCGGSSLRSARSYLIMVTAQSATVTKTIQVTLTVP